MLRILILRGSLLQGKGRKRKVSQEGEPPVYKWKQHRKK